MTERIQLTKKELMRIAAIELSMMLAPSNSDPANTSNDLLPVKPRHELL